MRCPTIAELPAPPDGKTGWPWTEESPRMPKMMDNGYPWPSVSIVTPSYNQGQFIEETIRSVLLQGYPNLEYIIIDLLSTDGSVESIKKYEPWLSYWVSEPDKGQSHAINKGFKMAEGQFVAWLNSDDFYLPFSIKWLVKAISRDAQVGLAFGICDFIDEDGKTVLRKKDGQITLEKLLASCPIGQAATIMQRDLLNGIGWLNEELYYVMDWELWLRIFEFSNAVFVPKLLAKCYVHKNAKTVRFRKKQLYEHIQVLKKYLDTKLLPTHISSQIAEAIARFHLHLAKLQQLNNEPINSLYNTIQAFYFAPQYILKNKVYWPIIQKLPTRLIRFGIQIKKSLFR